MYEANPTSTDDKKVVFTYDYMSRRVRKQSFFWSTDHWQLATDQLFVYDDWNVIMVLDGLDNNAVARKYSWGLDLSGTFHDAGGIGGLLAVEETTGPHQGSYWFFYDANGNVGQLVKGSDAALPVAAQYEHDAYGNPAVAPTGTYAAANPFRFSTKWLDAETALYYYGYRYYSPSPGRWISRDPIEEAAGVNMYALIANSPNTSFDNLGMWAPPPPCPPGTRRKPGTFYECEPDPEPDPPPRPTNNCGCVIGTEVIILGQDWNIFSGKVDCQVDHDNNSITCGSAYTTGWDGIPGAWAEANGIVGPEYDNPDQSCPGSVCKKVTVQVRKCYGAGWGADINVFEICGNWTNTTTEVCSQH